MRIRPLLLTLPLFAAIGCGVGTPITSITHPEASTGLQGKMFGGQQPVVGATVSVFAMTTTGYGSQPVLLGSSVLTDNYGGFTYGAYTCPANNPPVYILGQGGNAGSGYNAAIALTAGIGNCNTAASVYANINEVTTAATAFSLSHFFGILGGGHDYFGGKATAAEGNNAGLVQANLYTIPLLVSIGQGTANVSTPTVTLESAKLNSIANTIAACVNSSSPTSTQCTMLFSNTTPPGTTQAPSDVLQAAVQMALYPYQNVSTLYGLAAASPPFSGLPAAPADWTLGVSYTAPALGLSIAGTSTSGTSSNIDIDATGRVWFPTNKTTAHGVAYFDPATTSFSSVYGTGLASPQYVAIDTSTNPIVYATDVAGSSVVGVSTTAPSAAGIVTYNLAGATALGPVAISYTPTTNNAVLFAGQKSTGAATYEVDPSNATPSLVAPLSSMATGYAPYTFMVANPTPAQSQTAANYYEVEASTSGAGTACQLEASYGSSSAATPFMGDDTIAVGAGPCISGGAAQMAQGSNESLAIASTLNQICSYDKGTCFAPPTTVSRPEGIAIDGDRNVWIANSTGTSVTTFAYAPSSNYTATSPIPYAHSTTMPKPYGLAIDRSGNVWISNAGCVNNTATACTPGSFVLSELIGAAAPTLTPLAAQNAGTPSNGSRPQVVQGHQQPE